MSIIIDSIRGTDILIAFTKLKKLLKFIFSKSCGDVLIDSQKKNPRNKNACCNYFNIIFNHN